ncbi:MAG: efflux RND transporter periplasmic adaptor subunit, partial [Kofleriaceae bacterium]|nr:efflux RND transporter periplasmic adaptor subunit [Kofleriaceae bacterium]
NPSLIPVFQAKGDWCEEHGFPESFCPIHHPELGGRPTGDVTSSGAPADGTKVHFRTKETATLAGIEVVPAEKRSGGARVEAAVTIVYDATRHAEVNARATGVIKTLSVDVGSIVTVGAALAKVDSAAVGADRSRLRAAETRVRIAKLEYDRESGLKVKGIASDKEVLSAQLRFEDAKAERSVARAALGMVGTGGGNSSGYVLRAPLAGIVTMRKATVGHMVDLETVLFEIVDTSVMWAEIDVPEDKLSIVRTGQKVVIIVDAMPDREWLGSIEYLAPAIDPRTRTAKARISLDNPNGVLRANMYGQALIELGDAKPTVMIPKGAVQRAGGVALVFVRLAQDTFEARRVRIGRSEGAQVEILEGIEPGEPVATTGSFLLKTETLKGSIGAGCCDVE